MNIDSPLNLGLTKIVVQHIQFSTEL